MTTLSSTELPELPEGAAIAWNEHVKVAQYYTADQVRAYATAALSRPSVEAGEPVAWRFKGGGAFTPMGVPAGLLGDDGHIEYLTHPDSRLEYAYLHPPTQAPTSVRLWDSQWVNVVNHDNAYRDWNMDEAIAHAVKLTEQYIATNVADGKLPPVMPSPPPSSP